MIRLMLMPLALVFATAGLSRGDEKYAPEGGKFTITFPGTAKPKESKQDVDTAVGKLQMSIASVEVKKDLALIVIYSDYPEANAKPQEILARARDGAKGATGKLLEDKEIALGKVPGRDFLLAKEESFYRARMYLDGKRLYQVIVSGVKKDDVTSPGADKFLDSLELGK